MKVVHICSLPVPPEHPDHGRVPYHRHMGRWVLNLALAQKAHTDIEPQLMVQVPGAAHNYTKEIEGIPVHFLAAPDRLRSATFFWFDARRLVRKVRALLPDVVHAHGTEDAHGLAAQRSGFPYVITAQGLHFLINRHVKPKLVSRERMVEFTERRCLEKARHVIAKSAYVRAALAKQFPHLQLHEIPNTFDPRLLGISGAKEPGAIAFVGTIIPRKGLDLLCEALPMVQKSRPEISLWVFGDHAEEASEYEEGIKNRLRGILGNKVVFHGTLPALEVARVLAHAKALVAPSREEMFGNQLIESLLVGTHAIVTDGTAMAENIRRFGGGTIVPQSDSAALAKAIESILQSNGPPNDIAVKQKILDEMGPEVVARRHRVLYSELLGERTP